MATKKLSFPKDRKWYKAISERDIWSVKLRSHDEKSKDEEFPLVIRANNTMRSEIKCAYQIIFCKTSQPWLTAGIFVKSHAGEPR